MNKTLTALLNNGPIRMAAEPSAPSSGNPPAETPVVPEGGGLIDGLSAFMDKNPDAKPMPDPGAPVAPVVPDKVDDAPVVDKDTDKLPDLDLELPGLPGAEVTPAPVASEAFDESAFDAATTAMLASLEEKGHPGDVYKDLRAKLKDFEKNGSVDPAQAARIAELEAENTTLSASAAEVQAMKDRVASVTSRSAVLLLEENSDYQSRVSAPYQEITETVDALSEVKGIPSTEIWAVIKENDPVKRMVGLDALEVKLGEGGGRYALQVGNMANDIRKISALDAQMRGDAEAIVAAAKEKELGLSSKDQESRAQAYKVASSESFTRHASKIPGFTDATGNMTDAAKTAMAQTQIVDVSKLESGDLGYMAFAVNALPQALRHVKAMEAEIQDLRVAAGGNRPAISGGKAPSKAPESQDEKNKGFMDNFMKQNFNEGV